MATSKSPLRYRTLPRVWPGRQRPVGYRRPKGPFKITTWSQIERALNYELDRIGAKDVELAIELPNPAHWNMMGAPRADARTSTPAVILAFTRKDGVRLTFPCDTYGEWQTNVYAIARSLEALRAVDRYGVTQGDQQYVGFKALPPGTNGTPAMSEEDAAGVLAVLSELPVHVILAEPSVARLAVRIAKGRAHPDAGGHAGDFAEVAIAAEVMERLHGKEG